MMLLLLNKNHTMQSCSGGDTITISDSVTFSTHNLKSLAYSQENAYLYYQKQDKQGASLLYRYNISGQTSEQITSVSSQGKMKYANQHIYIMDVEQIEVLSSTDTTNVANIPKSTINQSGGYTNTGFSASSAVAIAGPGNFIYGHQGTLYTRELDYKRYELKDHLGNVRVVISDVKEPTDVGYDQFTADLKAYYNLYSFGMEMPDRCYFQSEDYSYGFNGQEREDDISGAGNHIIFNYRIHDARLGRFFSVDPISSEYPWNSSYAFAENDVIRAIDLEGAEKFIVIDFVNGDGEVMMTQVTFVQVADRIAWNGNTDYVQYKAVDWVAYNTQEYNDILYKPGYTTSNGTVKNKDTYDKKTPEGFILEHNYELADGSGYVTGAYALENHKDIIVRGKIRRSTTVLQIQMDFVLPLYFDTDICDQVTNPQEAGAWLDELADFMNYNPSLGVDIAGHTDDRQTNAYAGGNQELSEKRAGFVASELSNRGVGGSQIGSVSGHADRQPVSSNSTSGGRAQNRRVEVDFNYKRR